MLNITIASTIGATIGIVTSAIILIFLGGPQLVKPIFSTTIIVIGFTLGIFMGGFIEILKEYFLKINQKDQKIKPGSQYVTKK